MNFIISILRFLCNCFWFTSFFIVLLLDYVDWLKPLTVLLIDPMVPADSKANGYQFFWVIFIVLFFGSSCAASGKK